MFGTRQRLPDGSGVDADGAPHFSLAKLTKPSCFIDGAKTKVYKSNPISTKEP
jgi:hypothetical protein